jgi:hypothetical protein
MTPAEFNAALYTIGWSKLQLAHTLGCNSNITRRWGDGTAAIPRPISAWLRSLETYHRMKPPPQDWRKRGAFREE